MRTIIAHFKERPKTAVLLLVIALLVAAGVWVRQNQYARVGMPVLMGFGQQESTDVYGMMGDGIDGKAVAPTMVGAPVEYYNNRMMPPYYETAGQTAADVVQKIIKTGSLDMLVRDVSAAATEIGTIAAARGGYLQSSSISEGSDGTYRGNVVVRVPVEKFEATMTALRDLATLVRNESSNGQDVTEQYTDLEAQLRNAKAQEETYLEVLKQAKSVEDVLKVQERLGAIRAQIESLQGRIQYLANTTSLSTISVNLSEETAVRAPTKEFRPIAIVKEAFQTLIVVVQDVIAGLIWFVIVWGGILLPTGLVIWLAVRAWKRRVQR